MTESEKLAEWTILRTIQLQAVATWMLRDIFRRLERLEADIAGALIAANVTGQAEAAETRRRLTAFNNAVEERTTEVYREIRRRVELDFETIGKAEEKSARAMMAAFEPRAGAVAVGGIILGLTVRQWMQKLAGDVQSRAQQAAGQGVAAGESPEEILRRIRGWSGGRSAQAEAIALPPISKSAKRAIEVVIRTGVEATGQEILTGLGEKAPKSIRMGWQQISVLDSRTTQVCRAYAFKIWNRDYLPIGHALPFAGGVPRHANCRSRIVPFLFDDGPTKELTFKAWMDSLKPEEQNQIFGAGRVKAWKAGKVSDAELIRQQERAIAPDDLQ